MLKKITGLKRMMLGDSATRLVRSITIIT